MNIMCLGGAGMICREAVQDLVKHSSCQKITIADYNEEMGREILHRMHDPRVDFVRIDVRDKQTTIKAMEGYDVVMDGTTIALNCLSTECIALAGCHGINLNGFGEEDVMDAVFKKNGKCCIPGFGMTPGLTQMMAMDAANNLDKVLSVRVSHGAFRPIAFSPSITETTTYEYAPELPGRVVYENNAFIQVQPFARPREIQLPPPYGLTTQYIIPHAETKTLAKTLAHKGVRLIEVRGTWPRKNMQLIRALYDWGILKNEKIDVSGEKIGVMDCIAKYLMQSEEGKTTDLYGYALHVEVEGERAGKHVITTYTHTHPASDGSVAEWEGLRSYTRNVAIPLAIATEMIAKGMVKGTGILFPEEAFVPREIFAELAKRDIFIQIDGEQIAL